MPRSLCFLVLALLLGGCGGIYAESNPAVMQSASAQPAPARTPAPDPQSAVLPPDGLPDATLQVGTDGCSVTRPEFYDGTPGGLRWVVSDAAGAQVLASDAEDATVLRLDRSGHFDVVLKAWDGNGYATISNTAPIACT